jgi:O-antigen ligase
MSRADDLERDRAGVPSRQAVTLAPRLVEVAWIFWLVMLPVGHVTGLHNSFAVLMPIAVFALTRAEGLAALPALGWLVSLAAFASLSLLWSGLPEESAGKLRSDLLFPLLGYASAYLWTRTYGARSFFLGFAGGLLLLALMSAAALLPPDTPLHIPLEPPSVPGSEAFPADYPGTGDASTYATLVLAPLIVWRMRKGHWRDATSTLLALSAVLIIFVSHNRNAVLCFPIAIALFALLWQIRVRVANDVARFSSRRILVLLAASVVAIAAGLLTIEKASEIRLDEVGHPVPFGSAALTLMSADPRPAMWSEYMDLGRQHPWIGVGFGRTVPARIYHVRDNPVMQAVLASGLQHAHNIFLNWWLQLGLCGLLLYLAAFTAIIRAAWAARRLGPGAQICAIGIVTLIAAALVRNLTDDFLVYGIASSFWIALGGLFGLAQREARSRQADSRVPEPQ